jgi:hypothetical protein
MMFSPAYLMPLPLYGSGLRFERIAAAKKQVRDASVGGPAFLKDAFPSSFQ